jgi:hypothetical protein
MTIKEKLELMEQMKLNNKQHVDDWKNNKK